MTSAALAQLSLADGERLINLNLAQLSVALTKDSYSASSTACSLPRSFLTFGILSSLQPTFSTFLTSFILHILSSSVLIPACLFSFPLSSSAVSASDLRHHFSSTLYLLGQGEWQRAQLLRTLALTNNMHTCETL